MSDPYDDFDYDYEIDFVTEYDDERPVIELSHYCYLEKAPNGHLVFSQGCIGRRRGEDWGEASYSEHEYVRLNELDGPDAKLARAAAIEQGRDIKPGEPAEFMFPECFSEDGRVLYLAEYDPENPSEEQCAECDND